MAINVLPPTTGSSSLKQYQREFTQENGWVPSNMTSSATWQNVAYGAGLHVACANTSLTTVSTSPDGITWTVRLVPGGPANWVGISYGGGYFVLTSTTNRSAYSTDGITWTAGGTLPSSSSWAVAAYGNGAWVACSSTAAIGAYSLDHGVTWAATTQANTYVCMCYGAGLFVGIVAGSGGNFSTSLDGAVWTDRNSPNLGLDTRDLAWSGTTFVGLGVNTTSIVRSTDGITWTRQLNAMPFGGSWFTLEWGGGRFAAANSTVSAYSLDGVTWVQGPNMSGSTWQAMSYGGGRFVAIPAGQVVNSWVPSNSWTCPAGVSTIDCLLVGSGGAGGGSITNGNGGGGGAGQYVRRQLSVVAGTTYPVIIGTGGLVQVGGTGLNGMDSSFGTLLVATGGGGGGTNAAGLAGAAGGGAGSIGATAGAGGGGGAAGSPTNLGYTSGAQSISFVGGAGTTGTSGGFGASTGSSSGSGGLGINGMAGGGGGGSNSGGFFGGGSSGGGRGGAAAAGQAALSNTGSGGGGGGSGSTNGGGAGGSGYCLITWWA